MLGIKKYERTTIAISNCLPSPTSENPHGFSVWCLLAKLTLNHATTHSRDRWRALKTNTLPTEKLPEF